ncbi:hypothetical protein M426DRAFT_177905 [Hypoxylon sp. CI-4A]|nr:hypothetical protein M426DRAFT_177905 [Hypoxylon sp. CI-4A]
MYSPYGSYSSMSSATQPMEIPTNSYLSYNGASCAFPSWPQRSSLTESAREERASSYLSDDDLFPCDSDFDDSHSISSSGSTTPTSPVTTNEVDLLQMQREQMAMQREAIKFLLGEKERRRQQQQQQQSKRQRRSSSGSSSKKSSPKSKPSHLDAIAETGE